MTDSEIIKRLKNFDPEATKLYFYGYCQNAYNAYNWRYSLSRKTGLDFFSLAHDYYITLIEENFASLVNKPEGWSLENWMFGAFRYVILNGLRNYNQEYIHLQAIEEEKLLDQLATNPVEQLMPTLVREVEAFYKDGVMTRIARMIFVLGYKQNEVAAELGITPSAINQRVKRMMEEVVVPFVYLNYPQGIHDEYDPNRGFHYHKSDGILYSLVREEFDWRIDRVTPEKIKSLSRNQVFVFDSNLAGRHVGATAQIALLYGAEMGYGVGQQGQTYAIPTMTGGLDDLRRHVEDFIEYAKAHPEMEFLVPEIGCGIAGYSNYDMGPLFVKAAYVKNILLPEPFWRVL